jgi:hypothetical protein
MRPADKHGDFLGGARQLIADEAFAVCVLSAVIAAAVLAFGFGATADIVVTMLVMGAVTALAETRLQKRR